LVKRSDDVAIRCRNGNIYTGVNVYSNHGACAEMIAIGSAITNGEREFECLVAARDLLPFAYSVPK